MKAEEAPGTAASDEAFIAALVEDDPAELYDRAPCAYLSALPDGKIVKVNDTFCAWTGYDRDAVVGRRRFQDLLAPGDRIFFETHVAPLLRMQGQAREIAAELLCEGSVRLPVIVNSVLKRDGEGEPRVIRTAMFDATERRAYERELLAARRRAEESEAAARALARTLQASLLPPALPVVPGFDVGAAYRPSGDGSVVGGDFYDLFEAGDGRWSLLLGDVCGKGPETAGVAALARHTVRAQSMHSPSPSAVLTGLHVALMRYHPERFCTAVLVNLEGQPALRATVASGGHHLPLVLRAGGGIGPVGEPGRILGMLDPPAVTDSTVLLSAGDVLVVYTDGVTEARRVGDFFDDERLHAVVAGSREATAQDLADRIVAAALDFQDGRARDDIAVVVARVTGSGQAGAAPPAEGVAAQTV